MKRLARDVLLLALATGVSRLSGLFRDAAIADRFGATGAYDAFLVAFFLPHFLRQLLAEGALSTAFISVYTESLVTKEDADRFANNVLSLLLLLLPLLVGVGILLAPSYLPFLASGFPQAKLSLTAGLAQVVFPFIALVSVAAVFMGILNARRRFLIPALAPVWFNVAMVAGALFLFRLFPAQPIYGLALGAVLGGAGELLFQLPALRRVGFRFHLTLFPIHPAVRKMARLMAPALFILAVDEINLLVDNKLASHLAEGAISSLQYAMRLFQLPLGVFAVSIATALLPRLSADWARGEKDRFAGHLTEGVAASALILLPATAGLLALGPNVVRLLFEHGTFTPADTVRTAHALSFYLIGVLPYGLAYVFTRAFYALGRTRLPLLSSIAAVATNVVLDVVLVGPMQEGGLALATSVAGVVDAAILGFALWRTTRPGAQLLMPVAKMALGTGLVFLVAWGSARLVADSRLLAVLLPTGLGIVVYAVYTRLAGLWELIRARDGDRPASG